HQGSEYVLDDPCEVTVGRSGDVDLTLVEGMVSRRHAVFRVAGGELTIEDAGSTNGTFVNGDKIRKRSLQEGDRVLIGTTILKVVFSRLPLGTKPPPPKSRPNDDMQTTDRSGMTGRLEEVGVPELLEMFGSARQRVILELESPRGNALVWIAGGRVLDCEVRELPGAPAAKCIGRALGFESGSFAVRPYHAPDDARLDAAIPELLVDGLFKLDESTVLRQRLPADDELLALAKPMVPSLNALDERDLEMLQRAHNLGVVQAILDDSPETDLETCRRLLALVERGYLRKS
ncbi:MAG TPA: FHA domain-containing protein, partial [Polyangiaceae bacterium]|nr:FHA domain-containing protein [Polyangiaceae bacterium]